MRRFFKFHLRKYFRRMPKEYALKWRHRLAGFYFFLGWNALAVVLYYNLQAKYPETEMEKRYPGLWVMRLWKIDNVKYIKVDNFNITAESNIENKNLEVESTAEHWTMKSEVINNENSKENANSNEKRL